MSTTRPRITITLTDHSHEVLRRLSASSSQSMSSIVAEFVDMALPSLERVVVVLERARTAPEEVRAGLAASVARAERDMMPHLMESIDQVDMFLGQAERDVGGQVAPATGRARVRAHAEALIEKTRGPDPRPVTRGSGGGKSGQAEPERVGKFYSAINPVTGKRVLLPVGKCFGRDGAIVKAKGAGRG